jgi:hypothetical protein
MLRILLGPSTQHCCMRPFCAHRRRGQKTTEEVPPSRPSDWRPRPVCSGTHWNNHTIVIISYGSAASCQRSASRLRLHLPLRHRPCVLRSHAGTGLLLLRYRAGRRTKPSLSYLTAEVTISRVSSSAERWSGLHRCGGHPGDIPTYTALWVTYAYAKRLFTLESYPDPDLFQIPKSYPMFNLSFSKPHSNIYRSGVKRLTSAPGATKTCVRLRRVQLKC